MIYGICRFVFRQYYSYIVAVRFIVGVTGENHRHAASH